MGAECGTPDLALARLSESAAARPRVANCPELTLALLCESTAEGSGMGTGPVLELARLRFRG